MSLYGAMCWVGGWDFIGMAVATWWHVIRVRCSCVSGSNNLQQLFLVLLFISFGSTSSPIFVRSWGSLEVLVFVERISFDIQDLADVLTGFYTFLLTEICWYSYHWSLWTVWFMEQSSESFISRSAGSEKF